MTSITHEQSLDQFYKQIDWALANYKSHGLNASDFNHVVIGGLGGSGIGGRIARLVVSGSLTLPVEVYSEYTLPAYCNEKTLVILCSYSGNTEETLAMFNQAAGAGCRIVCLASGGKVAELAKQFGLPFYPVETGYQPRMALGYSLTTLLMFLGELSGYDYRAALESVSAELKNNQTMKEEAKRITEQFKGYEKDKFVVVCDSVMEAVAVRFCQQVQENAKGEAFVTVLPEANHNVIESYYGKHDTNFILLNSGQNSRINHRFEFLTGLLNSHGNRCYAFEKEPYTLGKIFRVIHILDWVSIYLSNIKGEDNMFVNNIARLKTYLD
jgi:glucose/mannose-6-phosphate isomerase